MHTLKSACAALTVVLATTFAMAPTASYAQSYVVPAQGQGTTTQYNAPQQPVQTPQASTSKSDNDWVPVILAGALLVGLIVALGSASSSSSSSSSDKYVDYARYERQQPKQPSYESRSTYQSKPDTSIGCVWGDRAYGTCR